MCGLEDSQKPSLLFVTRAILYLISINGIYLPKTKGRILKLAFFEFIFSKQIPSQHLKFDNNGLPSLLST